ncbi:MAG: hypothetical protein ACI31G_02190 [Bacilli bacterium]
MEYMTKKVHQTSFSLKVKEYEIFHWKLSEEKQEGEYIIASFTRDDSVPQIETIRSLEKEYFKDIKPIPFYPVIIFCVLAFIILTSFLITFIISENKDIFPYFVIPSTICIVLAAIYSIYRINSFNKLSLKEQEKKDQIILKIKEIEKNDN